jgi:hypothetical protein
VQFNARAKPQTVEALYVIRRSAGIINYRMSPENAPCLTAAGLDCCVLANNHVLDWGPAGLIETLDVLVCFSTQVGPPYKIPSSTLM